VNPCLPSISVSEQRAPNQTTSYVIPQALSRKRRPHPTSRYSRSPQTPAALNVALLQPPLLTLRSTSIGQQQTKCTSLFSPNTQVPVLLLLCDSLKTAGALANQVLALWRIPLLPPSTAPKSPTAFRCGLPQRPSCLPLTTPQLPQIHHLSHHLILYRL
jgi:hypothetical protein